MVVLVTARILFALALALAGCAGERPAASQRAAMLVDKHRASEAIAVLRDHLAQHPDALPERRLLIRVLALTGDLGGAERETTELARRLPPDSPVPWIEMGHAFELAHRYEDALNMYDRAAEVAPHDPIGPRTGGTRAATWGEVELAEPRLTEAVRRDPRDAKSWHALGWVRLELRDFSGAKQAYRAGLKADPSALENRVGLATLAVAQGDAAGALAEYDVLARARPKNGDFELGRSWALLELGRLDEAEASLARAESLGGNPRAIRAQRRLLAKRRAPAESQRIR
jgi:Flp pilus assembly protein TadD